MNCSFFKISKKFTVTNYNLYLLTNKNNLVKSIVYKQFSTRNRANTNKSIFGNKKTSKFDDEQIIDITESQKEFELNRKLEIKNLEK